MPNLSRYYPFIPFFLVSTVALSVWLFAFYPGLLSPDSISQWEQADKWNFYDWHPYFHTLYVALFQKLLNDPAAISIFQVLAFSSCFSGMFHYFWRRSVSRILLLACFVLFCLSIPIGLYAVTIWKDVAFTLCAVMLAFFLSIKAYRLEWSYVDLLLFTLLVTGSLFFRHNGVIYIGLIPLLVLFYTAIGPRQKALLIGITIISFVIFKYLIPSYLEVKPRPSWMNMQLAFSSNAHFHHFSRYTKVSPQTQEWLGNVNLPPVYRENYNPFNSDYLTSQDGFHYENYHNPEFWKTMQDEFFRFNLWHNLPLFIGQRVQVFIATTFGYGMTHAVESFPNDYFIQVRPLSQTLNIKLKALLSGIQNSFWHQVVWNSFFPLLLIFILWVTSFIQRDRHFQIFGWIILIQAPLLLVFNTAPDWRYSYIFYLAALIALPLFFLDTDYLLDQEILDILDEDENERK